MTPSNQRQIIRIDMSTVGVMTLILNGCPEARSDRINISDFDHLDHNLEATLDRLAERLPLQQLESLIRLYFEEELDYFELIALLGMIALVKEIIGAFPYLPSIFFFSYSHSLNCQSAKHLFK